MDHPTFYGKHINVLELKIALESAKRWGHLWSGRHIRLHSDNTATVASINKGTSRGGKLMALIQELFWLAVEMNFKISAVHIPGISNIMADRISRLTEYDKASDARLLLANYSAAVVECKSHMTTESFIYLQDQWRHVSPPWFGKLQNIKENRTPSLRRPLTRLI